MTTLLIASASSVLVLVMAWGLVRAAREAPRRGPYARFVRPPQARARLTLTSPRQVRFTPAELGFKKCSYGAHLAAAVEREGDLTICEPCKRLRNRKLESFLPEGVA